MKIHKKPLVIFIGIYVLTLVCNMLLFVAIFMNFFSAVIDNAFFAYPLFIGIIFIIPAIAAYYLSNRMLSTYEEGVRRNAISSKTGLLFSLLPGVIIGLGIGIANLKSSYIPLYSLEVVPDDIFTIFPTVTPTAVPKNLLVTKAPTPTSVTQSVTPTAATPTSTPLGPTDTPVPTATPRTPNPPQMNISYPSENQTITMNSSQTFCVVDTPAGGDGSVLQRKHSINDASWTTYTDMFTLCFDPQEGLNRFQLQYKNKYGEESPTYTRQFTFHRTE